MFLRKEEKGGIQFSLFVFLNLYDRGGWVCKIVGLLLVLVSSFETNWNEDYLFKDTHIVE